MKVNIPYTLNIFLPIIGWSILCSAFSFFLILSLASFELEVTKNTFLYAFPVLVLVFSFLGVIRYGGAKLWSGEEIKIINENVSSSGELLSSKTETINKIFTSLVYVSRSTTINVFAGGLSVLVLMILALWVNQASSYDLMLVVVGGVIAIFFSCAFATFFCQQAMFNVVKECRRILIERGEDTEDVILSSIAPKFYFLFFLPFFTILIILLFIPSFSFNAAMLCFVALLMTFIIDKTLFSYISNSLNELQGFAKELPVGERAVFITGSLDKEIVSLSEALNKASEQIYFSKKELERSKEDMAKRVEELEKFFKLTVNRELKMIELKKELKKCIEKQNSKTD
ncbi:MAG: Sensor protein GacS [Parcubacteria bacterium 34_609]|nr:MAG: Sensor protein GacS [Parcubacteria bacterium 34_609]KUK98610.1 MAG: Sensor protein GacS [Parcubacteria bacterium 32_520]